MIGYHINFSQVVPEHIRLCVYHEALKRIEETIDGTRCGLGLCLFLPMILWGKEIFDTTPLFHTETEYLFPEMKGISEDIGRIMHFEYTRFQEESLKIRKQYLTNAIKKLS